MSKLLEDPKIASLVEKEAAKAVKAERSRILEGVKELKSEYADSEDKVAKKTAVAVVASVTKIVKDAA